MKHVKQPKRHIILDDFEWRALVKGVNEYRKQVIDENGCVEVVNERLLKIIDAPTRQQVRSIPELNVISRKVWTR